MAINYPVDGQLITDSDTIKIVSSEHNLKILTKNPIRKKDREEHGKKINNHNLIMKRSGNENLEQNRLTFDKVVEYIILKNKNMYKELIKSGP